MEKNEAEVCDIVVGYFEECLGVKRGCTCYPERDGSGPPVDLRVQLGDRSYAVEHTLIEPFPNAIQAGTEFNEFAAEIVTNLGTSMPGPGTYRLVFPLHPTAGRHRRTHAALRTAIISWVGKAAAQLHADALSRAKRSVLSNRYTGERSTTIDGLDLTLGLRVTSAESSRHDGRLFLYRAVDDQLEAQRRRRLAVVLDKKYGKLERCSKDGDATILVLEYSDIALTNHILVAEALEPLVTARVYCPDHIVLADTTDQQTWCLFHPVIHGNFSLDMEDIPVERV